MKKYFVSVLIILALCVFFLKCSDSDSGGHTNAIIITGMGWAIENIDTSFWEAPSFDDPHAFYNFFIRYEGDLSASDIKSARVYLPNKSYWTLDTAIMLDTENKIIGGWYKFYDNQNIDVLPIDELKAEIVLNSGETSVYNKTIPAPGSATTNGFHYVYTPEEVSPFNSSTPLIKRAVIVDKTNDGDTITINFTVDDSIVYNGWIWFFDNNNDYLGASAKPFRDYITGALSPIISGDLYTDGDTNTVILSDEDIAFSEGAEFDQVSGFILVLTDGWQYESQGRYSAYDCRSISERTWFE